MNPEQFELEDFLPYRLSLLTNTISQGIAESYRSSHDISVPEWRVMAVLGRFPGSAASEVADRTAMDKVAISRAVSSLVEKGLLERRIDDTDRRRQRLFITAEKGQQVLGEIVPGALRYEKDLLLALTSEELEKFDLLISRLLEAADKKSRE